MIKQALKYGGWIAMILLVMAACNNAETKQALPSNDQSHDRDVSIVKGHSYSDLFFDSIAVEKFIREHGLNENKAGNMRDFYESRNYQYAWFDEDGLDEHGKAFWNLRKNFVNYSQDSSFFNKRLHQTMEGLVEEDDLRLDQQQLAETELMLTEHFFDYAKYAFTGKVDPRELKWYIPRKKVNAVALLDSLIARNGQQLDQWEPLNRQYKAMRPELMRYYDIEKKGGWTEIPAPKKAYREGDSAAAIQQIKERLRLTGDYAAGDATAIFTPELKAAVQTAQHRFGLTQDGIVGPGTLRELNKPVSTRIEQMLVNMERMRWMPAEPPGKRLVANIPEYKLHVYDNGRKQFDMRIVVGKAANRTVVFNDQLKHVVFSPYWNIPRSIVRNEILPAMQRNPRYLASKNMEQTGTSGGLPVIRQNPGPGNALGKVKFIFPNSYAIYFHDTPAKSLFERDKRAFSHGCIRLAEPKKLAKHLLQGKPGWDDARIEDAMNRGSELWVNLDEAVPVVISYFTSWVDDEGLLHFREDIYGHDKALAAKLFE